MPVFYIDLIGTLPVRALLEIQFSFIILGKFLADDIQVPSSAPGKARFFGLFSFFTLVRLVRMCKIVILSVKYEFYIHGSGVWLSAEGEIPSLPTFCK